MLKKSSNAFCDHARKTVVSKAFETRDWEGVIKNCLRSKIQHSSCSDTLGALIPKMQDQSKEAWEQAKTFDRACRNDDSDFPKTVHEKAITETVTYGSWQEIIRTIKTKCRADTENSAQLIATATKKFLKEIKQDPSVKDDEAWTIYWELKYRHARKDGDPSKISIALTLADICVSRPMSNSKQTAYQLVDFLENYSNTLAPDSDDYSWGYAHKKELRDILRSKMDDIKGKIDKLPEMKRDGQTGTQKEKIRTEQEEIGPKEEKIDTKEEIGPKQEKTDIEEKIDTKEENIGTEEEIRPTEKDISHQTNNDKPQEKKKYKRRCQDFAPAGKAVAALTGQWGVKITSVLVKLSTLIQMKSIGKVVLLTS